MRVQIFDAKREECTFFCRYIPPVEGLAITTARYKQTAFTNESSRAPTLPRFDRIQTCREGAENGSPKALKIMAFGLVWITPS